MRNKVLKAASVLALISGLSPLSLWAAGLKVQTFKTHSRLMVAIDDGVPAQWKKSRQGFDLLLKGIGLADLGAPLGGESAWTEKFKTIKDPNLSALKISESAAGVRIEGRWKYLTGLDAPADAQMETFEFRDKTPHYVIDFWPKKGPTLREVQAARAQAQNLARMKAAQVTAKKQTDRRLASEKMRADGENVSNFCQEPLSDKTDVFLPFLPYHEKVDFSRWIPSRTPDENFTYYRPTSRDKESQYIRLALDLYKQGKNALVLRTLDFFEKDYPQSDRMHEMRFLRANALIKLGLPKDATPILARLGVDSKDSSVAVYAAMFTAGAQIEGGSSLAALESFLWLINHYPEHHLAWVFHLGAAESLFSMKQTERAAKEYQWVAENGPSDRAKAQAALRIGDLYLDRLQYEHALAAYYQGLNRFGEEAKEFPGVFVNRGETLYQLGQMDRAQDVFKMFLKAFPAHPSGWRATYRLGEINGRKADPESLHASRNWFYKTINNYPTSPGATLARLRLIPCGDHGGFDIKGLDQFMAGDAQKFDGRGEVSIKRYRDMKGLAYVRGLVMLGQEERAVILAMEELRLSPISETQQFLRKIIGSLFRRSILNLLDQGKKYEALAFYQDKKDMIIREIPFFQLDYLLKLSQAAADLGLGTMAQQLIAMHEKAENSENARNQGRRVASGSATSASDMLDEEHESEQEYSKAKALWVSAEGLGKKAEIRTLLNKISDRSRFGFEREVLLGVMDAQDGKFSSALNHVAKAQLLKPAQLNKNDISLETWLASLEARVGDPRVAYEMYTNLERHLSTLNKGYKFETDPSLSLLGVPAFITAGTTVEQVQQQTWQIQGELLEKMNRWGEAATVYSKLVEKGWGGGRVLFSYAKVLLKTGSAGNQEKGRSAMRQLASSTEDNFWKKLAKETLANDTAKEGGK